MAQQPASDPIAKQLREAWFRYLDLVEPIRPSLHRYCRHITRDIWDGEDLLQDTLLRGFGAIGRADLCGGPGGPVKDSRAYLFRIATNLWIDQVRHSQIPLPTDAIEPATQPEEALSTREATTVLLTLITPQERAAVVLKDVFDFTLEEVAEILATTVGATKSALHRGRTSLEESKGVTRSAFSPPSKELLDRFVDAFNARDIARVTELLLDEVTLDVPGVGGERGKNMIWLSSSMEIEPKFAGTEHANPVAESILYQDEWIVLMWESPRSASVLGSVNRFEEQDGHFISIREYYYCPETLAEIAKQFGTKCSPRPYHQSGDVLSRMISSATLPWVFTSER
jgi:RNA polymerase sigma-70 factor, ECF subfamily